MPNTETIDERLLDFCTTQRQRDMIEAVNRLGSPRLAAIELGIKSAANVTDAIRMVKVRAAKVHGYAPAHDLTRPTPEGVKFKGASTYYRATDTTPAQWVKTKVDDELREQMIIEAANALAETLPRLEPVPAPAPGAAALCNLFTITDAHIGMLAWKREGGADWDLKIAEDTLTGAFEHMIAAAPRARVAIVNQLGDYLHFDGLEAVTPTNRHTLDADGRFRKVIGVAVRVLRRIVDMALATHDEVHVVLAEGNHDLASSAWLQAMFSALYENEPRVTVNDSALPFYAYRHGKTLLGFSHGHVKAKESLPLLFAQQFRAMWGDTIHTYLHTGHRHHSEERDVMGIRLVEHATLAARDAYAARHGYHAARQALAITYHEEHGEVARATVTPGML